MKDAYEPIENYGVIGNLHTVALVSNAGSIDYLCLPRFDSPTVFAVLLDKDRGGSFSIIPEFTHVTCKQIYLTDSAILVTRFFADEGIAEITDFMPIVGDNGVLTIVRKVTAVRGDTNFNLVCQPRFNYAETPHSIVSTDENRIVFKAEDGQELHLWSDIKLVSDQQDVDETFSLKQGETACFVLQNSIEDSGFKTDFHHYCLNCYNQTYDFWKKWTSQCTFTGRWEETVRRSAITLKLLTSRIYGSVMAAATFALPETLGGLRNWDYRYSWVRDASFAMYVLLRLGFIEDAENYMKWVEANCVADDMQLMYTMDGNHPSTEKELTQFAGYKDSKPVLIGNNAFGQKQMDIYGELIDTIYLFNKYDGQITFTFWQMITKQIDFVCEHWQDPDHGLWEIRGEKRAFLHSRLMCWVALDRGIKIAESRSFPFPRERWFDVRDQIYLNIYNDFWNPEKEAYVQYLGGETMDASVLLMPLVRFITPTDPRWLKTLEAVERELKLDVLIYRYRNSEMNIDGLGGEEEGTFTMCSFWYAECLAKAGELDKANEVYAKILGYANPLMLYSEQLSKSGQQLGNFPQAFTHLSLISAALALNKYNNDN
jgi:GH15 family glucan-1,4-alpha-glucosidase